MGPTNPATPPPPPAVSVLMVTYNHEPFVAQAIESVLAQRTTFRYELVVGEDCSTDGTRAIVAGYARRHPDRVRALLRGRNLGCVGPERNLLHTLAACRGRYVAWLDGDDYFTCPDKLQRQADYLDANRDCVQCFHAVETVAELPGGPTRRWVTRPTRRFDRLQDHLRGNFMLPCSVMFRRGLYPAFPAWYFTLWTDDWPLFVLNAEHGRTGYLDAVMAVYRIHAGGWWQRLDRVQRQHRSIEVYDALNAHFGGRYDGIVRDGKARCHFNLAMAYERAGDLRRAADAAVQGLRLRPREGWPSAAQLVRVLLRGRAPRVYGAARGAWRAVRGGRRPAAAPASPPGVTTPTGAGMRAGDGGPLP